MTKPDKEESLWKAVVVGKVARVNAVLGSFGRAEGRAVIDQALWYAVLHGDAPVVKVLLAAGGKAEQANVTGTLLMNAAWEGQLEVVQALVESGAAVNRRFEGTTALEAALETNHVEVADYLKKMGAQWGTATLLHACQQGDLVRIKQAIAAGASIHRGPGASKETPLMRAAGNGQAKVVKYLLQKGAKPDAHVHGKTALWTAALNGQSVEVIDALVEAGADVNKSWEGCSVLMTAARWGCLPVVKRLVELGANVSAINPISQQGVLDCAREGKNKDVISYLRKAGAISARAPARDLARALAREFGGRPTPDSFGFAFKSKLSGFSCQFHHIGPSNGSVEISDLDHLDVEFRDAENAELILGARLKPHRGRFRKVKAAEKMLGVPVYRSVARGSIPEDTALQFCSRHCRAFKDLLPLSRAEDIWIGASFAQFTWAEANFGRLRLRLRAFGELLREVARQSRPESTHVWDG